MNTYTTCMNTIADAACTYYAVTFVGDRATFAFTSDYNFWVNLWYDTKSR